MGKNKEVKKLLDKFHKNIHEATKEIVKEVKKDCSTYAELDEKINYIERTLSWDYPNTNTEGLRVLLSKVRKYIEKEKMSLCIGGNHINNGSRGEAIGTPSPKLPPPKPKGPPRQLIGGLDLANGKSQTTHTININFNSENVDIEKLKKRIIESINREARIRGSEPVE